MSWKCRLGFHEWVDVSTSEVCLDKLSQCKKCRAGKMFYSFGMHEEMISPEMMRKHWDVGKIDNDDAYVEIYGEVMVDKKEIAKKIVDQIIDNMDGSQCDGYHGRAPNLQKEAREDWEEIIINVLSEQE